MPSSLPSSTLFLHFPFARNLCQFYQMGEKTVYLSRKKFKCAMTHHPATNGKIFEAINKLYGRDDTNYKFNVKSHNTNV
jgi:hypothetical protein